MQPSARGASVVTSGGYVAVEVQLQEMNVMSATLDEIQKQHQAIKTRVRPFSLSHRLGPPLRLHVSAHARRPRSGHCVGAPRNRVHSLAPSLRPFPLAQYEDEIKYLRMQVEAAGGQVQPRMESSSSAVKLEPSGGGALTADILAQRGNASLLDLYASGQEGAAHAPFARRRARPRCRDLSHPASPCVPCASGSARV